MAARSTGLHFSGLIGVIEKGVGGGSGGSGCHGGRGIVIIRAGIGKSRSSVAILALISAQIAVISMVCHCGGSEVGYLGVASLIEMLQEVVGRSRDAGGVIHSDAAVGQVPLQNVKGHLQTIREKPTLVLKDMCAWLAASIAEMLHEVH